MVTLSTPAAAPAGAPAASAGAPPSPSSAPVRRAAAVANAEGRFVFRDVPAGTYTLAATRNGYSPGATGRRRPGGPTRTFTIADGARVTDTVVSMWRLSTISGSVRDDRGEPVIGVYVSAMRLMTFGGRTLLNFGGGGEATDDRGHFRIHNIESGSYVLMLRATPQSVSVATVERYWAAAASGTVAAMARELRMGGALDLAKQGVVVDGWQVATSSDPLILPGPNGTILMPAMTFSGNVRVAAGRNRHRTRSRRRSPRRRSDVSARHWRACVGSPHRTRRSGREPRSAADSRRGQRSGISISRRVLDHGRRRAVCANWRDTRDVRGPCTPGAANQDRRSFRRLPQRVRRQDE